MPIKGSPPVATYNWAGLYVGGHVGAGFSYRNWTLGDGAVSEAGDAVMIGGQIGFNHQVGKWMIGIESDASWGNLKGETVCPDGINSCWTRQTWLGTVTGRIGYAFDPALFYLKGGAAFTRADYFKTAPIPSTLDERGSGARNGWTAGVGMDYALWNNWSLRLEYDYLNFGSRTFALSSSATGMFAENVTVGQKAHEVKLGLNYLFNVSNLNPIVLPAPQSNKSEAQPQRLGLPAPLDSPPFPTADWPLGGSQLIGVPDTAVGPLMKWIYDGPDGQAWKDSRIKLYGWAEIGANVSTSSQSLTPAGYPIHPNRIELDQLVFRIERLPDTTQKDHVDWGFNVTNIYGLDYRYTIMKGIFSDQLLAKNRTYGYDIPTFYGDIYFPQIAEGMNVRVGRYLSVPDIETQTRQLALHPFVALYLRPVHPDGRRQYREAQRSVAGPIRCARRQRRRALGEGRRQAHADGLLSLDLEGQQRFHLSLRQFHQQRQIRLRQHPDVREHLEPQIQRHVEYADRILLHLPARRAERVGAASHRAEHEWSRVPLRADHLLRAGLVNRQLSEFQDFKDRLSRAAERVF